jgi:hypothetical protein
MIMSTWINFPSFTDNSVIDTFLERMWLDSPDTVTIPTKITVEDAINAFGPGMSARLTELSGMEVSDAYMPYTRTIVILDDFDMYDD